MHLAKIVAATSLLCLAACSKASDEQTTLAEPTYDSHGAEESQPEQARTRTEENAVTGASGENVPERPSGVGSNAPSTGVEGGGQPDGPGTAGENVVTGGPGVTNSPSGATGSVNLGN